MSRIISLAIVFLSFFAAARAAVAPKILEKKFPFPSPVQWKVNNVEISLIAVVWGPADAPEMLAKGHEEPSREKPAFFPDRPYALALELEARIPGPPLPSQGLSTTSRLVLVKDVSGNMEVPMELMPSGFLRNPFDIRFKHSTVTRVWDFFPAASARNEFLFQAFDRGTPVGNPNISFRVLRRNNELMIVNAMPGAESSCPEFSKSFSGTVGAHARASWQLTKRNTELSGSEEYDGTGKTLVLVGRIDSFGNFSIQEQYPKHHLTGIFKGRLSRGCQAMTGYFSKPNGSRLLPFEFQAETANR